MGKGKEIPRRMSLMGEGKLGEGVLYTQMGWVYMVQLIVKSAN